MRRFVRVVGMGFAMLLISLSACTMAFAADEEWFERDGTWYYAADGTVKTSSWLYDEQKNTWYYFDVKGAMCTSRLETGGNTYFFGEDGRMLTGWVYCPDGEIPEAYMESVMRDDVYFCNDDGVMCTGWAEAMPPHLSGMDDEEIFESVADDEYRKQWYCLKKNGKVYYNVKENIDGRRYVFDEKGIHISGWIYDKGEGQSGRFDKVDDDTPDETAAIYNQTPGNYLYGLEDGYLAVNSWFDARKPGDDDDADTRSFYADSSGHIVTGEVRGSGASIIVRRKATKIVSVGTYTLEDWSTDVNVTKIDGKYYCIEDSGTRIDGILYLQGEDRQNVFPNGFYCFDDGTALETGRLLKRIEDDDFGSDGYYYYYDFADHTNANWYKGQGMTGVDAGRLYYQGLAVGTQLYDYELVYLPVLEEKSEYGTGLFLVDQMGIVQKGTKTGTYRTCGDGNKYKIVKEHDKDDEYGYHIYIEEKNDDGDKVLTPVGSDEAEYIFWDAVED